MRPLVTIIAICHKHFDFVIECLDSVINQSYKNIEVIIINNIFNDNSSHLIKNWMDEKNINCIFIDNLKPLTVTQNLNMALKISSGKYYQALSCDDVLFLDKIEKQVDFLEADSSLSVVSGSALLINEIGDEIGLNKKKDSYLKFEDFFHSKTNLVAPSVLIRTNDVKEIGGYDENLQVEDLFLWLKLTYFQKKIYQSSEINVKYRLHGSNFTSFKKSELIFNEVSDIFFSYKEREDFSDSYQLFLLKEFSRNARISKGFALRLFFKIKPNRYFSKAFLKSIFFLFIPTYFLKKLNLHYY